MTIHEKIKIKNVFKKYEIARIDHREKYRQINKSSVIPTINRYPPLPVTLKNVICAVFLKTKLCK